MIASAQLVSASTGLLAVKAPMSIIVVQTSVPIGYRYGIVLCYCFKSLAHPRRSHNQQNRCAT